MQHKQNYEFQIFPHVKISHHIVVVWFHIFTFFKRSCFQSVIRVISSASLSLIFIWWLSWVPVSTSITMSLSVNSYKHVSMKKLSSFSDWWLLWHWKLIQLSCDRALVSDIVFTVKTYNFDIIWHVLHLVALGHIFQQCHGDLPHLLVIGILQLSTLHKCDRLSRKLLIANLFQPRPPWTNRNDIYSQWRWPQFFLFLLDVGWV